MKSRIPKGVPVDVDGFRMVCGLGHDMSAESGNRMITMRSGRKHARCKTCQLSASRKGAASLNATYQRRRAHQGRRLDIITAADTQPAAFQAALVEYREWLARDEAQPRSSGRGGRGRPKLMAGGRRMAPLTLTRGRD